jgi:hypothetical protein
MVAQVLLLLGIDGELLGQKRFGAGSDQRLLAGEDLLRVKVGRDADSDDRRIARERAWDGCDGSFVDREPRDRKGDRRTRPARTRELTDGV